MGPRRVRRSYCVKYESGYCALLRKLPLISDRGKAYCHSIPEARDEKLVGLVARYRFIFFKASIAEPSAMSDHGNSVHAILDIQMPTFDDVEHSIAEQGAPQSTFQRNVCHDGPSKTVAYKNHVR